MRWYPVHTLWAVVLLLSMAAEWWLLLSWERVREISFFAYLSLLIKPAILFFASDLLFPEQKDEGPIDLKAHYFRVHRAFFLVIATYPLADLLDTLQKGWAYLLDLGPLYPAIMSLMLVLSLVAARTRSERFHQAFVGIVLVSLFLGVVNARSWV